MSCPCKELERRYGDQGCKCVHYREQFPNCECENCSVSDYSPGPVQADEVLVRVVYSSKQLNAVTGQIDPVHLRHDVLKRGLSVNRRLHISEANLRAKIESRIARDKSEGKKSDDFHKVVITRCDAVRELAKERVRLFCVYDTALENDASHADICQSLEPGPGSPNKKSLSMGISRRLSEAFSTPAMDLASIYSNG